MMRKSRLLILFIFVLLIFFLAGCSFTGQQPDISGFFNNLWLSLRNFWASIQRSLDNLMISIGNMFSGLSGVGEALRNMFRNFSIF